MERAYDYAHRITANGPFAVRKTKESVLRGLATDMGEAYKIESEISGQVFSSEDAKEGPKAFAEKRAPLEERRRRRLSARIAACFWIRRRARSEGKSPAGRVRPSSRGATDLDDGPSGRRTPLRAT